MQLGTTLTINLHSGGKKERERERERERQAKKQSELGHY